MLSEKYRPKSMQEMVGNEEARSKLVLWLRKWKPGTKSAMLVGPPGTGKTTSVHIAADMLGLNLIELNASDVRTREKLSKKVGEALASTSLFGGNSLIFLDEVDGLAGRSDYGALDFIKDAIKKSASPLVMAANDPDSDEVRKLGSSTVKVEFRKPGLQDVEARLLMIAKSEGMTMEPGEISEIAAAANGDLRAAMNFLQSGTSAQKDEEITASESLNRFFDAADRKVALAALRAYPGQPRDKIRDILVAVTRSRVHEERKARALEVISRADLIVGRMIRGKDWRLLRYLDPLLASELRNALGDGGPRYTADGAPWPLQLRIWNDSKKLKDIAGLAGKRVGISRKGFLIEDMPFVALLCSSRQYREELVRSLNLEENYDIFLEKESARARRAQL